MTFRKSSFSNPDMNCIEVGRTSVLFGVRDSKLVLSPVLMVSAEQGRAFVDTVKLGLLNR